MHSKYTGPGVQKSDIQPNCARRALSSAGILPGRRGEGAGWRDLLSSAGGACSALIRHRCCWQREARRDVRWCHRARERRSSAKRMRYGFGRIQVRWSVVLCGRAGSGQQLHLGKRMQGSLSTCLHVSALMAGPSGRLPNSPAMVGMRSQPCGRWCRPVVDARHGREVAAPSATMVSSARR